VNPNGAIPADGLHAAVLAAIHEQCVPKRERWSASSISELFLNPGLIGYVEPNGGFILARVAGDESEVLMLAVVPHLRRKGIGIALLRAAEEASRARGSVAMYLEVDTRNTAARALYARCGYCEVGHRRNYYEGKGDALVLRRILRPDVSVSA
jgi:[ribosomal protein S18]-alanine N-acetyltransferase